jgi:hypothetical protein
MSFKIDEFKRITCTYPMIFYKDKWYMEWSSLLSISNMSSTRLFNKINSKKSPLYVPRIKYKNRWLFEFEFCLSYWNNKELND